MVTAGVGWATVSTHLQHLIQLLLDTAEGGGGGGLGENGFKIALPGPLHFSDVASSGYSEKIRHLNPPLSII